MQTELAVDLYLGTGRILEISSLMARNRSWATWWKTNSLPWTSYLADNELTKSAGVVDANRVAKWRNEIK